MRPIGSVQEFTNKVQSEIFSEASFSEDYLYEGICKVFLNIKRNAIDKKGELTEQTLQWFGIGISEKDAKQSACKKACKFFKWEEIL
jgi:hypothetical protein